MPLNHQQTGHCGPAPADVPELPLVAIMGPTGSGKSDLALDVAAEFHGEIVNCDSLQVYRHFDLGTAKLAPSARRSIPHHLIDIVNPDELFTAGAYARMARSNRARDLRPRPPAGDRRRNRLLPARPARRPVRRAGHAIRGCATVWRNGKNAAPAASTACSAALIRAPPAKFILTTCPK